ncbi:MAG: hypothetical protein IJT49_09270 [Clostridia bacterium]|nr:hypothetical protein [Clostridia bacterium]
MKKTTICILLVFVFIFLCACSKTQTDTPSGMKLASVDAVDYYMYVPSSWTVADQDGITSAYVSIADKSNVTCARYTISNEATFEIPADKEESKPDAVVYAENYWTGYVTELEARLPGYRLISGPISTMLNGMPAVRCRYTATLSGVEYNFDMVICVRERMYAYLLTYTAEASKYDTNLQSFEKIISEFVFQTGVLA